MILDLSSWITQALLTYVEELTMKKKKASSTSFAALLKKKRAERRAKANQPKQQENAAPKTRREKLDALGEESKITYANRPERKKSPLLGFQGRRGGIGLKGDGGENFGKLLRSIKDNNGQPPQRGVTVDKRKEVPEGPTTPETLPKGDGSYAGIFPGEGIDMKIPRMEIPRMEVPPMNQDRFDSHREYLQGLEDRKYAENPKYAKMRDAGMESEYLRGGWASDTYDPQNFIPKEGSNPRQEIRDDYAKYLFGF